MERYLPKYIHEQHHTDYPLRGLRYRLGDLNDVIDLLKKDVGTRQAYLPVWFPEDTGVVHGERVPCTLGYHFIVRNGLMHVNYYIRSCDFIRHFRDDIYMTCRLVFHIIDQMGPGTIAPGTFHMHITSLHCFFNDSTVLKNY